MMGGGEMRNLNGRCEKRDARKFYEMTLEIRKGFKRFKEQYETPTNGYKNVSISFGDMGLTDKLY